MLTDLMQQYPAWPWWVAGFSAVAFVGSLVFIPIVVARMRSDYFVRSDPTENSWFGRYPALRWTGLVVKNLLGVVFVLAGIAMLVLPGQGILTILIGMTLIDFPGKRALEVRIARQRHVLGAINWIRSKAKRPPLQVPKRSRD